MLILRHSTAFRRKRGLFGFPLVPCGRFLRFSIFGGGWRQKQGYLLEAPTLWALPVLEKEGSGLVERVSSYRFLTRW